MARCPNDTEAALPEDLSLLQDPGFVAVAAERGLGVSHHPGEVGHALCLTTAEVVHEQLPKLPGFEFLVDGVNPSYLGRHLRHLVLWEAAPFATSALERSVLPWCRDGTLHRDGNSRSLQYVIHVLSEFLKDQKQ